MTFIYDTQAEQEDFISFKTMTPSELIPDFMHVTAASENALDPNGAFFVFLVKQDTLEGRSTLSISSSMGGKKTKCSRDP